MTLKTKESDFWTVIGTQTVELVLMTVQTCYVPNLCWSLKIKTGVNFCKQMSRTVSARIPTKMHEEIRERCNLIGESINDFIVACIEIGLYNKTDFDFGDEEETEEPEDKSENNNPETKLPQAKVVKIISD